MTRVPFPRSSVACARGRPGVPRAADPAQVAGAGRAHGARGAGAGRAERSRAGSRRER